MEAAGAMVALAAQGEDNFARNDLALLEISAGDHRIEVLDNNKKSDINFYFYLVCVKRPKTRVKYIVNV